MTKYNVGDMVRVLDVSSIMYGSKHFYDGMVTEITKIDSDGDIFLMNKYGEKDRMFISRKERHAVELVIDDAPDRRLAEAEEEIETLKCQLYSVEKNLGRKIRDLETVLADKTKLTNAPTIDEMMRLGKSASRTPNQRRADVIKRAQKFVADLEKRAISSESNSDGNFMFNEKMTRLTFHVNAGKGVVTALAHGRDSGKLLGKAFAKCAPGDVFNADIGKAIAAGRLYGVSRPAEFYNAPNPTEVVVGMRIKYHNSDGNCVMSVTKTTRDRFDVSEGGFFWNYRMTDGVCSFIEDTDAVY